MDPYYNASLQCLQHSPAFNQEFKHHFDETTQCQGLGGCHPHWGGRRTTPLTLLFIFIEKLRRGGGVFFTDKESNGIPQLVTLNLCELSRKLHSRGASILYEAK